MTDEVKRLYRSRTERWLFGVCGGIGEYFNLDPILIRAVFVILALIFGGGILIYAVLVIIIPREPAPPSSSQEVVPADSDPEPDS